MIMAYIDNIQTDTYILSWYINILANITVTIVYHSGQKQILRDKIMTTSHGQVVWVTELEFELVKWILLHYTPSRYSFHKKL